jgi:adenylosuccinate lyase
MLEALGLEPSEHSTQLVEPEHLLRVLLEMNVGFGVIANLADDLRNLQRSEIAELQELFTEDQVGSSTMPQKRNPWNSEHVKSLWKAFSPRVQTFFMDQISEHQRDLTNSASSRFIADYLTGYALAIARMQRVVGTLRIDAARMEENLSARGGAVLAEAAYLLLALSGHTDSHEAIRTVTLAADRDGTDFTTALRNERELWERISRQLESVRGLDAEEFFARPATYRGLAAERALAIGRRYGEEMEALKERLRR